MTLFIIVVIISVIFCYWLNTPEKSTTPPKKPKLPKDFEPTPINTIHQASDLRIFRDELNSIDL